MNDTIDLNQLEWSAMFGSLGTSFVLRHLYFPIRN